MTTFTCKIDVRINTSEEEVIAQATRYGREYWGHDDDWVPKDLNEAIAEILLMSDGPADHGVEIINMF